MIVGPSKPDGARGPKIAARRIGACIYCGISNVPLTREHVLPRGLGGAEAPEELDGALVLQEAACETCRRITQKIEEACLISMMDPGRARLGLKRPDRIPTTMPANLVRENGRSERVGVIPDEILGAIGLPAFYDAGIFAGRDKDDGVPCDYKVLVVAPAGPALTAQASKVGVSLRIDSKVFAQMLAKIALGATISAYGLTGFEPLVRNLILNNQNEYGYWVGGYAETIKDEPKTQELHTFRIWDHETPMGTFILVDIRLFAEFGGPTNYVVVGRHANGTVLRRRGHA